MKTFKVNGFTLLEVMVALSICAIAGIAAMQATGQHISHLTTLEEQTYASWVAENQLVMVRAEAEQWSGTNGKKGEEEMAGVTWYWRQEVQATADPQFVKLTISVAREQNMKNIIYDLTTFMAKGK